MQTSKRSRLCKTCLACVVIRSSEHQRNASRPSLGTHHSASSRRIVSLTPSRPFQLSAWLVPPSPHHYLGACARARLLELIAPQSNAFASKPLAHPYQESGLLLRSRSCSKSWQQEISIHAATNWIRNDVNSGMQYGRMT